MTGKAMVNGVLHFVNSDGTIGEVLSRSFNSPTRVNISVEDVKTIDQIPDPNLHQVQEYLEGTVLRVVKCGEKLSISPSTTRAPAVSRLG